MRSPRNLTKFILISSFLLNFGCERPLSEPERADPIYLDLETELKKAQSAAASTEKEVFDLKEALAEVKDRDPNRKRAIREFYAQEKKLEKLKQNVLYQELLLEKRRLYSRQKYLQYYKAKQPWPDKNEYGRYVNRKRLRNASRNWSDRVPKLSFQSTSSHQEPSADK